MRVIAHCSKAFSKNIANNILTRAQVACSSLYVMMRKLPEDFVIPVFHYIINPSGLLYSSWHLLVQNVFFQRKKAVTVSLTRQCF